MKKTILFALSLFALAHLSGCATTQASAQAAVETKAAEVSAPVATKAAETAGLPDKKANSEVSGRGIKLPTESNVPIDKSKSNATCTCDETNTSKPLCPADSCG